MSPRLLRVLATLRHVDATRVDELFPAARRAAILEAIRAGEAAAAPPLGGRLRRRLPAGRRRLVGRIALPAFAALVACVLAAVGVAELTQGARHANPSGTAIHASPVSFRYPKRGPDGGDIVATVTDPLAAQSSLDAAFRAAGLYITVTLVPASPSAVGTVVEISEPSKGPSIETLTGGTCVTGGGGPGNCPIGLKIPRDFTGSGSITLGRPAKPGEEYASTNSAFAPGESLHCSGLIGATVATAGPVLAARGITVQWRQQEAAPPTPAGQPVTTTTTTATATAGTSTSTTGTDTSSTGASTTTATSSDGGSTGAARRAPASAGAATENGTTAPPAGYHIVDGTPISAGVVMLETQAAPLPPVQLAQTSRMYGAGC